MSSELVTVFVPADAWQQALAESILAEAEIVYSSQNAQTQDLLGAGQISGYNFVVGPVQIRVGSDDAERARRLIAEAVSDAGREDLPADLEDDAPEDKAVDSRNALASRYANVSITPANALEILAESSPDIEIERIGVLRSHAVRHGPGPFPTESMDLAGAVQEHNTFGDWQGAVRYGCFDAVLARYALDAAGPIERLAVTHLDAPPRLSRWRVCTGYELEGEEL